MKIKECKDLIEISRKLIFFSSIIILLLLISILAWDIFTPGEILLPSKIIRVLSDAERLKEYILQYELFAPVVLFLIQLFQVILSPIPGNVTTVIGGSLFGIFYGLILNTLSIYTGSFIAFYLARKFGKPLVVRMVGESVYQKYNKIFEEKYIFSLFMIFLFPFFPDDALCLLTGLSSIPRNIFLILLIVGRFPGILIGTLVGSGLLELSLQGWIIIGILLLISLIVSIGYGKDIENWLYGKVLKKTGKE